MTEQEFENYISSDTIEMYESQKTDYFKSFPNRTIVSFHEFTVEWMEKEISEYANETNISDSRRTDIIIAHKKVIQFIRNLEISQKRKGSKLEQEQPKSFEELFYKHEHAEPCLKILNQLNPPAIDTNFNFIGKAKGIFPLWVKVLKNHKPEPLIKHYKDIVYKDILNKKIIGLNLSKDASEFRKTYIRLENAKVELDLKALLSQYSQSGK
ncbi:MAG: hypothetical protein LKG19_15125 [Saprospiraceae bacterium]|nr:hypothetical protein [Saprospiraceae bacterium]